MTQEPDMGNHAAYEGYYALYKKLYRDLKEDFKLLSGLKRDNPP